MRCLVWRDDSTILIGDLGGNIYKWDITGSIGAWITLEGSVIHMRQSHNKKVGRYYVNHCLSVNACSRIIFVTTRADIRGIK